MMVVIDINIIYALSIERKLSCLAFLISVGTPTKIIPDFIINTYKDHLKIIL